MNRPGLPPRSFPELDALEHTATMYAWSMLCVGLGVGFAFASIICSMPSCEPPREPVAPPCAAPALQRVHLLCQDAASRFVGLDAP